MPTTPSPSFVSTALEMIIKGGWIMLPLALTSLAAAAIAVERFLLTRPARLVPPQLLQALLGDRDQSRALAACNASPSPLAAVVAAGLHAKPETREMRMTEAAQRELRTLRRRMKLLSCLPQTATMLGLLGTVIGMIRTFTVIAASGESLGKTERLAQGIYEAWTATAAGLAIAIPTLIAYHLLQARLDHAAGALESAANLWLNPPPAAPRPASEPAAPPQALPTPA